mgnify:CR=1 FL=1
MATAFKDQTGGDIAPTQSEAVVIRFAGDSGDGMQLTGGQFTLSSALAGSLRIDRAHPMDPSLRMGQFYTPALSPAREWRASAPHSTSGVSSACAFGFSAMVVTVRTKLSTSSAVALLESSTVTA